MRRSRQSKSFREVAASINGLAKRSRRLVKVLRMEEAVTGAKSMMSEIARAHCGERGKRPLDQTRY